MIVEAHENSASESAAPAEAFPKGLELGQGLVEYLSSGSTVGTSEMRAAQLSALKVLTRVPLPPLSWGESFGLKMAKLPDSEVAHSTIALLLGE